ncbi:hypothetical protein A2X44_02965 [candidate division CPR3 bacterium GWF2_35_18]|uniref:Uncharacterized protein n=1 Tax=candidate division CPR3 bacterium GW2011_GWF2_35_18 TaxID=1618350 RepID=A0A0G0C065_UNCC3|nr:MAG: hypothetical protein UR67_C0006G0038 [candidate division CPR3 bacterium GW2011_GWF2_35_18]KKP86526.1 MAG: hypothetical protein UR87_C0017G0003 [candidate division CPR3 bacterium GW2011_GWE2_35_7]OGB62944.1 MAG: hypothetical protein A2X44_02965 [candidate division CPR3 bacterium GWF2_35_18]OGB65930.1 MAG: hypothetical protein A2250_03425 [candidate division CPR3 bacterium RIFOXYA2_FULL_35_13]OGB80401.1 MAG: hypothetical protein A2011_03520 [candidate division CPR3 bacterium GWE2_35_7]
MNQTNFPQNSLRPSSEVFQNPERIGVDTVAVNSEGVSRISSKEEQPMIQSKPTNLLAHTTQQHLTDNEQTNKVFAKDSKNLTPKEISFGIKQPSNSSMFWFMMMSRWEIERQKRRKL